ncbi:hypothetical protein [Polaromonas aquatica]|uniref:hypothetical protein n=1 Tax=Polaromonas aquatica TaxID=332657 RepID=UPI003D65FF6E
MQGFASVSMQYCGKNVDHMVLQAPADPQDHHHHAGASEDALDHAMHAETTQATGFEQAPDAQNQLPDAAHKCGVCASCCNLVGMTAAARTVAIHSISGAVYIEPSALIHSVPSALPEKPPRA